MKPKIEKIELNSTELALFLGLTTERVNQLRREQTLSYTEGSDAVFNLQEAVHAYCSRLRQSASGHLGESQTGEKIDATYENGRKARAQANLLEMQVATAEGRLLSMDDMIVVMSRVISSARSELLALGNKLPTLIHNLSSHDVATIRNEVQNVLERLSADTEKAPEHAKAMALEEK